MFPFRNAEMEILIDEAAKIGDFPLRQQQFTCIS